MQTKLIILLAFLFSAAFSASNVTVITSNQAQLQLHVAISSLTIDDLKPINVLIGLPDDIYPELQVQMNNKKGISIISEQINTAQVEWKQLQKLRGLWVGTLQITPGTNGIDNGQIFCEMSITVNFTGQSAASNSNLNDAILASKVLNWSVAKYWIQTKNNK